MRKIFLLIIFITGSASMTQGLNARPSTVETHGRTFIPENVESNHYICCQENNFYLSNLNSEDDDDLKPKPAYLAGLSLDLDILFIAEVDQLKHDTPSFCFSFSRNLFKLNRVFRL